MKSYQTYTLYKKPTFVENQVVEIDMEHIGLNGIERVEILGKSMTHIIDIWIVRFDKVFSEKYPYKTTCVPHTAIIDPSP